MIFNKRKKIQWSKDNVFNKMCWDNWIPLSKITNLDIDLITFIKLTQNDHRSKCKTQFNKTPRIKLRRKCRLFWVWWWLFDTWSRAQSMKVIIDKLNFIHIKNFFSEKENIRRMRRQTTHWKKIFSWTYMV